MKRASKKEIRAAVEKLKQKPSGAEPGDFEPAPGKLTPKQGSRRIRKKGV